jgi:Flp pilus assembly protein TadG
MNGAMSFRRDPRRGGTLIEFSFVAVLFLMILFTIFEVDRLLLVTSALAEAARAGVRYAVVHGVDNPTTLGPATTAGTIKNVVSNIASTGILNTANLDITSTYAPGLAPGATVQVTVTYPYDPFTTYFPLTITLGSTSEGTITY